jgi:hypothetical protein
MSIDVYELRRRPVLREARCYLLATLRLYKISRVLVRLNQVASVIVNANHCIVGTAAMFA